MLRFFFKRDKKWALTALLILIAIPLIQSTENEGYYVSKKIEYMGISMIIEALTTEDGIEAYIRVEEEYKEKIKEQISPVFILEGPGGGSKRFPVVSTKCESFSLNCLSIGALFEFWCNDYGGWDIIGHFRGKGPTLVGHSKFDSIIGEWRLIVMDASNENAVMGEVVIWINITKPNMDEEPDKIIP